MEIKRLDHLGIVAGVIKELGLIDAIDERLQKDELGQEKITPGEAVAGMILNGLGFSDKPLSLTPHFFETKALEVLFRPGVEASDFNRHKLGKVLDKAYDYGCESLFFELSARVCAQEKIDLRFNSLDTTTFSLSGQYDRDTDENEIKVTHGYSKDVRPDLKQVVQELMVSQDGGIPLMSQSWDGNASDNKIFNERAKMLIEHFKQSDVSRYLIADSKLYSEENASNLQYLKFITRIPGTNKEENTAISDAVKLKKWHNLDTENKYSVIKITHHGMKQRWIIVFSNQARERASKTLDKNVEKEQTRVEKDLWHLSNQAFNCASDAERAALNMNKLCRYHNIVIDRVEEKRHHGGIGRPKKDAIPNQLSYYVTASLLKNQVAIDSRLDEKSCYVLGTNVIEAELSDTDVISAYKRQNASVENTGFRFLKDPIFFASSLFLKKPSRISGLLMVMTLALLIYSIAQRRVRQELQCKNEVIPNQIGKPIKTPTMRWLFQLMEGLHFVVLQVNGVVTKTIHGWTEMKKKIVMLMGDFVMRVYGLKNTNFSGQG